MHLPLLLDGALVLEVERELVPLVRPWLPFLPEEPAPAAAPAVISVREAERESFPPDGLRPTLHLGPAVFLHEPRRERFVAWGRLGGCSAEIRLAEGRAELRAPRATAEAGADLYSMLTVTAALLLGRLGRTLMHAGCVVAPSGGAWLLPGDSHAGKSTACANLLTAGWRYVSDDQVILSRDGAADPIRVEGWPRIFHIDHGWASGDIRGIRGDLDPQERWPGRWERSAPLAGVLLPSIRADSPTVVSRTAPSNAFVAMVRQSPWLVADPEAATSLMELLRDASGSAFALSAGLDSYSNPDRLVAALSSAGIE